MHYFEKLKGLTIKDEPIILAIESSCDETAAAVLKGGRTVLSNEIISSASQHVKYGGVVPELASRAHTDAIEKVCNSAIEKANITLNDLDAIAVTYGAGLLGALLVGVSYAKSLAFALDKPLVGVSHIRGHMAAAYLADKTLQPPFISLLASGGHTAIINVYDYYNFEKLGETLDDAAGEAFDKVARVLGLPYPGGPNVERLAKEGSNIIPLPKMLKGHQGFDFSYSGLKTAVINYVHKMEQSGLDYSKADVAASFQSAALDILADKAIDACLLKGYNTIAVGGGVAANGYLRETLTQKTFKLGIKLVLPDRGMCTDNAAMIGAEGFLRYKKGEFQDLTLNAKASVELK